MSPARPARAAALITRSGAGALVTLSLAGCVAPGPLDAAPTTQAELAVAQRGDDWLSVGKRLLNAGEPALALKAFERSILLEAVTAEAMSGAGIAAERQGLVSMAARYFVRARDLAPESEVANNNLGVVLFRLEEYYPARQAFQAAFALSDGRNELALRNLRLVERKIADLEAGRRFVDPAMNMEVRRLGQYEFELVDFDPPDPDYQIGEPDQPAIEETPEPENAVPGS